MPRNCQSASRGGEWSRLLIDHQRNAMSRESDLLMLWA
jgi:hypothetical protein